MTLVPHDVSRRIFTNEAPSWLPSPPERRIMLHITCSAGCGRKGVRCFDGSLQVEENGVRHPEIRVRNLSDSLVLWFNRGRSGTTHMDVWLQRTQPRISPESESGPSLNYDSSLGWAQDLPHTGGWARVTISETAEEAAAGGAGADPEAESHEELLNYPAYIPVEAWIFRNTTPTWTPDEELVGIQFLDQPRWPYMTLHSYGPSGRIFTNEAPSWLLSPPERRVMVRITCSEGCGIKGVRCLDGSLQMEENGVRHPEIQVRNLSNSFVLWFNKGFSATTTMEVWLQRTQPKISRHVTQRRLQIPFTITQQLLQVFPVGCRNLHETSFRQGEASGSGPGTIGVPTSPQSPMGMGTPRRQ